MVKPCAVLCDVEVDVEMDAEAEAEAEVRVEVVMKVVVGGWGNVKQSVLVEMVVAGMEGGRMGRLSRRTRASARGSSTPAEISICSRWCIGVLGHVHSRDAAPVEYLCVPRFCTRIGQAAVRAAKQIANYRPHENQAR